MWCGAPKKEEGLILNLNSNSKSAPGFLLFKAGVSGKDNLNCKESVVADANLPSTVRKSGAKLNPWFVTGFCDGESCFSLAFFTNKARKFGFRTRVVFSIGLHIRDKVLLEQIQSFFGGVGKINMATPELVQYRIFTTKELEVVIKHFEKYPLITQKWSDFQLWKEAFERIKRGEHLNLEGFKKLVELKASINKGLSDSLKTAFPDVLPVERPKVKDQLISDPNWLAGFATGEGCLSVNLKKTLSHRLGVQSQLEFSIGQHTRDEQLIKRFMAYFLCGMLDRLKT